ncbi:glycosyltransferase family 4 protein [Streptantibioticus ferralitis]|uniref:D-inositol 3-phosphate glycosyltransferase n=1 Tax=Streptantibioticus ferralitis TaxID=236510 RepID=A0ABT5Z489_9ACTN|nr:glycosyltransferase family 4 protein [Streptantibioticus ferralitis]MDF2258519.1 glycosyltransferase family 4 protein [Streptantibioticus ferralitis]
MQTFNQELTEALAKEHDVTLLTADPKTTRPHAGAKTLTIDPAGDSKRDALTKAAELDPRSYGLNDPQQEPYDLIIGHSRFSGPAAAALRENWYPDARVAHFLHTSPERLDEVKGQPEKGAAKAAVEREVMQKADLVVGVGPLLTEEAQRLSAQGGGRLPDSHELVPGTGIEELVQHSGPKERLNLLLMGRTDDPIKGVDDALRAVRQLRREGMDVHLTIRGANEETLAQVRGEAAALAGGAKAVTVLPRTDNKAELNNDIRNADAVIMPSRHEGFGLVATEGAGHGVPILVNEESGAARFLNDAKRVPPEIGRPCVVPEPPDPSMRPQAWADAIHRLKDELPQRQQNAVKLRETLKGYSWEHAARGLTDAAMRTTPATHQQHTTHHQRRNASVQAAYGELITEAPVAEGQEAQEAREEFEVSEDLVELLGEDRPSLRDRLANRAAAEPVTAQPVAAPPVIEGPALPPPLPQQGPGHTKGPSL